MRKGISQQTVVQFRESLGNIKKTYFNEVENIEY
jgi:hypothetical protein